MSKPNHVKNKMTGKQNIEIQPSLLKHITVAWFLSVIFFIRNKYYLYYNEIPFYLTFKKKRPNYVFEEQNQLLAWDLGFALFPKDLSSLQSHLVVCLLPGTRIKCLHHSQSIVNWNQTHIRTGPLHSSSPSVELEMYSFSSRWNPADTVNYTLLAMWT